MAPPRGEEEEQPLTVDSPHIEVYEQRFLRTYSKSEAAYPNYIYFLPLKSIILNKISNSPSYATHLILPLPFITMLPLTLFLKSTSLVCRKSIRGFQFVMEAFNRLLLKKIPSAHFCETQSFYPPCDAHEVPQHHH